MVAPLHHAPSPGGPRASTVPFPAGLHPRSLPRPSRVRPTLTGVAASAAAAVPTAAAAAALLALGRSLRRCGSLSRGSRSPRVCFQPRPALPRPRPAPAPPIPGPGIPPRCHQAF